MTDGYIDTGSLASSLNQSPILSNAVQSPSTSFIGTTLGLPREIRQQIFSQLLCVPSPRVWHQPRRIPLYPPIDGYPGVGTVCIHYNEQSFIVADEEIPDFKYSYTTVHPGNHLAFRSFTPQILFVCRLWHTETVPLLYSLNAFTTFQLPTFIQKWLPSLSSAASTKIRSLILHPLSFANRFMPAGWGSSTSPSQVTLNFNNETPSTHNEDFFDVLTRFLLSKTLPGLTFLSLEVDVDDGKERFGQDSELRFEKVRGFLIYAVRLAIECYPKFKTAIWDEETRDDWYGKKRGSVILCSDTANLSKAHKASKVRSVLSSTFSTSI